VTCIVKHLLSLIPVASIALANEDLKPKRLSEGEQSLTGTRDESEKGLGTEN